MRFTFVRHGETIANTERRIQGHTDTPLCPAGEEQASKAGERLRNVRFTRVYASDLCRASGTCRLILEKNTRHPPPMVIDTRLRERNFGSVEGLVFDEVLKMAKESGSSWLEFTPPGAETNGDMQTRLVAFFKEVCQSVYDKTNNNIKKSKLAADSEKETKSGDQTPNNPEKATTTAETPNGTHSGDEGEADMEEENLRNEAKEKEEKRKNSGDEEVEEEEDGEHVLVVSHGAALRQLFMHLHRTLGCPLPASHGPEATTRISPNTGISQYTLRYSPKKYTLNCLCFHDNQHMQAN